MKPFLLSLAVALISLNLPAQSDLQSDPDIEWIGAFTADYRFDPVLPGSPFEWSMEWNMVGVEKLLMPPLPSGFPSASDATEMFLKIRLWESLRSMECVCYEDPQLQTPLSEGEPYGLLSSLDTVEYVDETTNSAKFYLQGNEAGPEEFHGVRVYQLAYLRKSTRRIGYRAVSWTPLLADASKGRENVLYKPTCWFPSYMAEDPESLAASDEIPYVFVTNTRNNTPLLANLKPLKGEMNWEGYFSDFIRGPWATAYSHDDNFAEFNTEDIQQFPDFQRPDGSESLFSVRFIVRWFWDEPRRRLYYEPVALAPVGGVYDENGGLVYLKALFWVKTGE